jgi:hypothetical protein
MEGDNLRTSLSFIRHEVKLNLNSLRVVLEKAAPVDADPTRCRAGFLDEAYSNAPKEVSLERRKVARSPERRTYWRN